MRIITAARDLALRSYSVVAQTASKAVSAIGVLTEEYKLIRRLLLAWACGLITWVTLQVFEDLTKINAEVNVAYGIVVGLLGTVLALYQTTRAKEDKGTQE